ncbi:MAG TPA: hypothetical protein VN730_04835 [Steroidobacteraceae bacterium]|nr:hypothetical protein [Steroidobacteraceae bacterium]
MITGRFAATGKTRTCPHCRATILDSATVCPGCHHHLRFDSSGASQRVQPAATPLRVEGTLRHPANCGSWEYSVVLAIRNDRGEEIARQVVGVGALQPGDTRTFSLAVEVFKPAEARESKSEQSDAAQHAPGESKSAELRVPGRPGLPPAARPTVPLADGNVGGARPPSTAAPASPPAKWPIPAPAPSFAARPGAAPVTPSVARPAAPPAAPGRMAPGQPLRPSQSPPFNGGAPAPGRGVGPGLRPKR